MLNVLEIGCGTNVWFGRQLYYSRRYGTTPFTEMMEALIKRRHRYFCLDKDPYMLGLCRSYLLNYRDLKQHSRGVYKFLEHDAERLPFENGVMDMVIMSDVLTCSPTPYCGCNIAETIAPTGATCPDCNLPVAPGASDEQKLAILDQALRVMHAGSHLILGFYQTPQFAENVMKEVERLERTGVLKKLIGIGRPSMPHYDEDLVLELMFSKT